MPAGKFCLAFRMNAFTRFEVSTALAPGERNTITLHDGLPFVRLNPE